MGGGRGGEGRGKRKERREERTEKENVKYLWHRAHFIVGQTNNLEKSLFYTYP